MASIRKEILINVAADQVWDAVQDIGALHTRIAPGVVVHTAVLPDIEPPTRMVTFADGLILREVIVDRDDAARRLVWAIEGDQVVHHNASMQVFGGADGSARVVWVADVLPHTLGATFGAIMDAGMAAMKTQLERQVIA